MVCGDLVISYYEQAPEQKAETAIIFLHGWRSEAAVWFSLFKTLHQKPYTLYALDLPGFGKSETPRQSFTLNDYAKIVREFVLKVSNQISPVIIIGHSFGARIALNLTAENPELVKKLILVGAGGARIHSARRAGLGLIARMLKPFFTPLFMQPLRRTIYQWLGADDYIATPHLKQTFLNIISENLDKFLLSISCPTLIVWGANDTVAPVSYGVHLHKKIRNSQLTIIPNAGHFSFLDQPEEFSKIATQFLLL